MGRTLGRQPRKGRPLPDDSRELLHDKPGISNEYSARV